MGLLAATGKAATLHLARLLLLKGCCQDG